MREKVIMTADEIRRALVRVAHEVAERNRGAQDLLFVGIRTRGVPIARRLASYINEFEGIEPPTGEPVVVGRANRLLAAYLRELIGSEPASMRWRFGVLGVAGADQSRE